MTPALIASLATMARDISHVPRDWDGQWTDNPKSPTRIAPGWSERDENWLGADAFEYWHNNDLDSIPDGFLQQHTGHTREEMLELDINPRPVLIEWAKAKVAEDWAGRMSPQEIEDLHGVLNGYGEYLQTADLASDELVVDLRTGRIFKSRGDEDPEKYRPYEHGTDQGRADLARSVYNDIAMIYGTTGARSTESLLLHEAAAAEFGMDPDRYAQGWADPDVRAQVDEAMEEPGFLALRHGMRASYDQTQEYFDDRGIEDVLVHRGVILDNVEADVGDVVDMEMRPLSSFSQDAERAHMFAVWNNDGEVIQGVDEGYGHAITTIVPADRVLSVGGPGIVGTNRQAELVILDPAAGSEDDQFLVDLVTNSSGTAREMSQEWKDATDGFSDPNADVIDTTEMATKSGPVTVMARDISHVPRDWDGQWTNNPTSSARGPTSDDWGQADANRARIEELSRRPLTDAEKLAIAMDRLRHEVNADRLTQAEGEALMAQGPDAIVEWHQEIIPNGFETSSHHMKLAAATEIAADLTDEEITLIRGLRENDARNIDDAEDRYAFTLDKLRNDPNAGLIVDHNAPYAPNGITLTTREDFDKKAENRFYAAQHGFVTGEDAIALQRGRGLQQMHHRWAITSNNLDPVSLHMQEMAAEEFSMEHHARWDYTPHPGTSAWIKSDFIESAEGQYDLPVRHGLRATYDHTQQRLADEGIEEVLLFRGVRLDHETTAGLKTGGEVDLEMRPMSSWTTDYRIAQQFGGVGRREGDYAEVVLSSVVPADRIISVGAATGFGSNSESEVVVLDATGEAGLSDGFVVDFRAWQTPGDEWELEYDGRNPIHEDNPFVVFPGEASITEMARDISHVPRDWDGQWTDNPTDALFPLERFSHDVDRSTLRGLLDDKIRDLELDSLAGRAILRRIKDFYSGEVVTLEDAKDWLRYTATHDEKVDAVSHALKVQYGIDNAHKLSPAEGRALQEVYRGVTNVHPVGDDWLENPEGTTIILRSDGVSVVYADADVPPRGTFPDSIEVSYDDTRQPALGQEGDPYWEALNASNLYAVRNGWASTSNNHDARALLLQEAVSQEFGHEAHADWPVSGMPAERLERWSGDPDTMLAVRHTVRIEYDNTQAELKEHEINSLTVYRGMALNGGLPGNGNAGDQVDLDARPLSSWTTRSETANGFADGMGGNALREDLTPLVVSARVPASRIFSTAPGSGFGSLGEDEVVLVDGTGEVGFDDVVTVERVGDSQTETWEITTGSGLDVVAE